MGTTINHYGKSEKLSQTEEADNKTTTEMIYFYSVGCRLTAQPFPLK